MCVRVRERVIGARRRCSLSLFIFSYSRPICSNKPPTTPVPMLRRLLDYHHIYGNLFRQRMRPAIPFIIIEAGDGEEEKEEEDVSKKSSSLWVFSFSLPANCCCFFFKLLLLILFDGFSSIVFRRCKHSHGNIYIHKNKGNEDGDAQIVQ